jgi:hypothetical protein
MLLHDSIVYESTPPRLLKGSERRKLKSKFNIGTFPFTDFKISIPIHSLKFLFRFGVQSVLKMVNLK